MASSTLPRGHSLPWLASVRFELWPYSREGHDWQPGGAKPKHGRRPPKDVERADDSGLRVPEVAQNGGVK